MYCVMITEFSDGRDFIVHVRNGQSEGEEVADKEELDLGEGCARDEVIF